MPKPPAAGSSQNLRAGDVVLVKGSRGVHLERAIEIARISSNPRRPRSHEIPQAFAAGFRARCLHLPLHARADQPRLDQPFPAFRIAGNLYYVGSEDLASYLIVTPQGDILINSNLESSVR